MQKGRYFVCEMSLELWYIELALNTVWRVDCEIDSSGYRARALMVAFIRFRVFSGHFPPWLSSVANLASAHGCLERQIIKIHSRTA